MFCIKCGKSAFKDNLCEKCFLENKELFEVKPIKIRYCRDCEKYYTQKEKIGKGDLEKFLESKLVAKGTIRKMKIELHSQPDKIKGVITAHGCISPSKVMIEDRKEVLLLSRSVKCDNCVKISGNYHEAVLQVRGPAKEKIAKKIGKIIRNEEIANIKFLKEGPDILLVSKSSAPKIVRALRVQYKVKESFKLVGEKKGRKIYRNFYSIR